MFGNLQTTLRTAWSSRRLWTDPRSAGSFFLNARTPESCTRSDQFQFEGLPFRMRPIDWYAVEEIALNSEYACIDTYLKQRPDPLVLDVGANIGMFSLYVFSRAPGAVVHSYEPCSATFEILRQNRQLNPDRDWHVHHAALWSRDGTVAFQNKEFSTSGRVSAAVGDEWIQSVSLRSVLTGLSDRSVDVLKIDVEGAEEGVLSTHAECLKHIHCLIVEVHPALCSEANVVRTLEAAFPHVRTLTDRVSGKPMYLATRKSQQPRRETD